MDDSTLKEIYAFMGEIRESIKAIKDSQVTSCDNEIKCRKEVESRLLALEQYRNNQKAYWVAFMFIGTFIIGLVDFVIRTWDRWTK